MAISSAKVDIVWSPNHEDKFVTFGTDLSLYKVERTKTSSAKGQGMRIADGVYASLLSSNTNHQYMKCISWCPRRNPDHLIAVGQANGRVVLTSFGKGTGNSDPDDLIGKEFVPRHQRPCHALSWNPIDTNLLAEVLEKHKADNSIIIWDVNSSPASRHMMTPDRRHLDDSSITRSFIELGPAESTYSLCWFQHEPKTLVAGMNKYLKIFDLRDISRPQNMTVNKAVYCVSVDPHCEHRLASCHEGQILVWDVRSFDKPVLTFQEPRNVVKLSWCTARFGLLACLTKDSSVVKLFDVQHSGLGSDELEPAVIERMVHPYGQQVVSSFAWHPTHENRMLTVTPGGVIRDVSVFERISVTWSPSRTLLWSCGKRLIQCERVKKSGIEEDISVVMKKRANAGYGLKMNHIWENAYITDNNPQIQSLWHWLDLVGSLFDEGKLLKGAGGVKRVIGVNSFLRGDDSYVSCKTDEVADRQLEGYSSTVNTYRSDARAKSMQLCGWEFDKEYSLRCFIERLEADKQYERAAAIALFNLKLRMAIDVLKKGSTHNKKDGSINLSIVAMALSGYTDDKDALWREMCGTMTTQLMSPYIRAMFAFLTNESDNYKDVLKETGMAIQDRVAFACIFLPDALLNDYVDKLTNKMIDEGNLEGVLLTGLTSEGLQLLQRYVDLTGDVQTASLAAIQAFPSDISRDPRVLMWIESYRDLLDQWRLWHQRAEFDVHRQQFDTLNRPLQQVFVSCNFCGKSISYSSMNAARTRHYHVFSGGSPNKSKVTSCPGCRKPLPRCALCLINMGTPSGFTLDKQKDADKDGLKMSEFSSWFTWCQGCRHGGHANHITEWFKEHMECPVTGCVCKCMSLDILSKLEIEEQSVSPRNT